MAQIQDVAAYILAKRGPMTAMKLQKLCYYGQAWHLVWEERPLFEARIEAWANGPVIVDLYQMHRGRLTLTASDINGDPDALGQGEIDTIDTVLGFYADMDAHQLSELTHREVPWRDARANAGLSAMDRGTVEITQASMFEYYDSLTEADG